MTEKQRNKVSTIASAIFFAIDKGFVVKDEEGNIVTGLRYGSRKNLNSWSYLYYNKYGHLVSCPVLYCSDKNTQPNKKFTVDKGTGKLTILK